MAARPTRTKATRARRLAPLAGKAPSRGAPARKASPRSAARRCADACSGSHTGARTGSRGRARGAAPKLLSGGNPQIAKGDGDAPVRAYIEAMSGGGAGWKRGVGRRLDALVERAVPGLVRCVRWNSPFYGTRDHGWFLSFHCITRYVKVAFFNGTSLTPMPPVASKNKGTRYWHVFEGDAIDEAQFVAWCKQAAELAGWDGFRCE